MKRHAHLFPQLHGFGHLYRAYRKALRGSGRTQESLSFTFHLERELLDLSHSLAEGSYQPQPYRYFHIYEPKQRIISVAPFCDRVVHHAVVALLEPIFERNFIHDSYATRQGKGTHAALRRAQGFLRHNRWYYKADIEQYFASIEHDRLLALIERKVKDVDFLAVVERIIRNGGSEGRGLPIGNLTSQFFANVYLNPFDHWVKEQARVRHYLRYMDDFVLFSPEKARLRELRQEVQGWLLDHLNLRLKPNACVLNQRCHGLPFLGTRIFPNLIRLQRPNRRRLTRRLLRRQRQYLAAQLDEDTYVAVLNSYFSHLDQIEAQPLKRHLVSLLGDQAYRRQPGAPGG